MRWAVAPFIVALVVAPACSSEPSQTARIDAAVPVFDAVPPPDAAVPLVETVWRTQVFADYGIHLHAAVLGQERILVGHEDQVIQLNLQGEQIDSGEWPPDDGSPWRVATGTTHGAELALLMYPVTFQLRLITMTDSVDTMEASVLENVRKATILSDGLELFLINSVEGVESDLLELVVLDGTNIASRESLSQDDYGETNAGLVASDGRLLACRTYDDTGAVNLLRIDPETKDLDVVELLGHGGALHCQMAKRGDAIVVSWFGFDNQPKHYAARLSADGSEILGPVAARPVDHINSLVITKDRVVALDYARTTLLYSFDAETLEPSPVRRFELGPDYGFYGPGGAKLMTDGTDLYMAVGYGIATNYHGIDVMKLAPW